MFWDNVAGVYDVFVHVINRKTHRALRTIVADLIGPEDTVLECACGTGPFCDVSQFQATPFFSPSGSSKRTAERDRAVRPLSANTEAIMPA